MASLLVHQARIIHRLKPQNHLRNFSSSLSVLKRRGNTSSVDADDLFASSTEDDLFPSTFGKSEPPPPASSSSSSNATSSFKKPFAHNKGKKSSIPVKSAFEQFDEHHAFLMDRLGPKAVAKHPQVRSTAIRRLVHHSRGPEHLDRIMEVLVQWRNDGRVVDRETATEIIDRCLAWSPQTLLTILSDRPKYGVTLPDMTEARRALHRLVFYRPHPVAQTSETEAKKKANAEALKSAATLAALLPAHGLKRATEDPVCCALLAQACARNLLFAETLAAKEAAESQSSAPPAAAAAKKRAPAPLGAASSRGLLSISATLASLLSRRLQSGSPESSNQQVRLRLPSPEYVSAALADTDGQLAFRKKRMSGVTPSGMEEQSWIIAAVRDVVRAMQTPYIDGANKKPTLEVLDSVLQNRLTVEDAAAK